MGGRGEKPLGRTRSVADEYVSGAGCFATTTSQYLPFFNQGKSCQDILTTFPHAQNGMYKVQPDGGLNMFWAYCDMTSIGGGWTMCYSTDDHVGLTAEVTYDENLPYGTNGYRTDCNNIQVYALKHQALKNGFKHHGAPLLGNPDD